MAPLDAVEREHRGRSRRGETRTRYMRNHLYCTFADNKIRNWHAGRASPRTCTSPMHCVVMQYLHTQPMFYFDINYKRL